MSELPDYPIKPDRLNIYTAHMAYPVYIDGVPLASLLEAKAERDALREALQQSFMVSVTDCGKYYMKLAVPDLPTLDRLHDALIAARAALPAPPADGK